MSYEIDVETLKAEVTELIEKWAKENKIAPPNYKLTIQVDLRLSAIQDVEVQVSTCQDGPDEFVRSGATYLTRPLTPGEIDRLQRIPWNPHPRCIVKFVLEHGNVGTPADEINARLEEAGYRGPDASICHSHSKVNSTLFNHTDGQFRLTTLEGEDGFKGKYKIFRKKKKN